MNEAKYKLDEYDGWIGDQYVSKGLVKSLPQVWTEAKGRGLTTLDLSIIPIWSFFLL